jgi:hypothetical protein
MGHSTVQLAWFHPHLVAFGFWDESPAVGSVEGEPQGGRIGHGAVDKSCPKERIVLPDFDDGPDKLVPFMVLVGLAVVRFYCLHGVSPDPDACHAAVDRQKRAGGRGSGG